MGNSDENISSLKTTINTPKLAPFQYLSTPFQYSKNHIRVFSQKKKKYQNKKIPSRLSSHCCRWSSTATLLLAYHDASTRRSLVTLQLADNASSFSSQHFIRRRFQWPFASPSHRRLWVSLVFLSNWSLSFAFSLLPWLDLLWFLCFHSFNGNGIFFYGL